MGGEEKGRRLRISNVVSGVPPPPKLLSFSFTTWFSDCWKEADGEGEGNFLRCRLWMREKISRKKSRQSRSGQRGKERGRLSPSYTL